MISFQCGPGSQQCDFWTEQKQGHLPAHVFLFLGVWTGTQNSLDVIGASHRSFLLGNLCEAAALPCGLEGGG